jgi:HEAT repeat protein
MADRVIINAIEDPHPSVRIAAAEAISEMEFPAAEAIRRRLSQSIDESAPELAYALSTSGDPGDIPLILRCATEAVNEVGRKRALLGAARLLGVEKLTYQLMLKPAVARDTALIEMGNATNDARFNEALRRYGNGDYAAGILSLAEMRPELLVLAELNYPEAFLMAAASVAA